LFSLSLYFHLSNIHADLDIISLQLMSFYIIYNTKYNASCFPVFSLLNDRGHSYASSERIDSSIWIKTQAEKELEEQIKAGDIIFFHCCFFYETQVLIKRMHEHRFKKRKEKKEKQRLFSFVCMFRYSYNKIFRKICENYCRWLTT